MKTANRAMTLIEVIVWVSVFTAIMIALVSTLLYLYRTNAYAIEQASAVASGERGLDVIVRTIREATYSSNGAYPIVSIAANQITFYVNSNPNSSVEKITYFIQGNSIYQSTIEPQGNPPAYTTASTTINVADYVHNIQQSVSVFTYYDNTGTQISDYTRIADVRFVSVNLVVDVNPNDQPGKLTLRSSAALRNLITSQ